MFAFIFMGPYLVVLFIHWDRMVYIYDMESLVGGPSGISLRNDVSRFVCCPPSIVNASEG